MSAVRIRCLVPPIVCRKEGIALWNSGDEAEVVLTPYWQGMVRHVTRCVNTQPSWAKFRAEDFEATRLTETRKGEGTTA